MKQLKKKLEDAFHSFGMLQEEMETLLKNRPEKFPSQMENWTSAYRKEAANLQFLLDSYRESMTPESEIDEARKWQERLGRALVRQDRLYELVEKVKKELEYSLKNITDRKNAITGYHSGNSIDKPVFISKDA